jgi:hypothetical protein
MNFNVSQNNRKAATKVEAATSIWSDKTQHRSIKVVKEGAYSLPVRLMSVDAQKKPPYLTKNATS